MSDGQVADWLGSVRVVLVGTTHSANIGRAARAMWTMGLSDLRLVAPRARIDDEARANASHAGGLLEACTVHGELGEALGDAALVLGLTARQRRRSAPELSAREAAAVVRHEALRQPVALVFGREHAGLTNDELSLCHYAVHIPANPAYSSLNLAASVQVVAYELYQLAAAALPADETAPERAGAREVEGLIQHLARVIEAVGYERAEEMPRLERRLRRLFNRARLEPSELHILRGVLAAVERRLSEPPHTNDSERSL